MKVWIQWVKVVCALPIRLPTFQLKVSFPVESQLSFSRPAFGPKAGCAVFGGLLLRLELLQSSFFSTKKTNITIINNSINYDEVFRRLQGPTRDLKRFVFVTVNLHVESRTFVRQLTSTSKVEPLSDS